MSYITLQGSLVQVGELKSGERDGRKWTCLPITLVQSERIRSEENGKIVWKDGPSKFWGITLWGWDAESFAKMDIPKGTNLFVSGSLSIREIPGYVNKKGESIPARTAEEIRVEHIGICINKQKSNYLISVTKPDSHSEQKPSSPVPPVVSSKPQEEESLFSDNDDLFGESESTQEEEESDDLFS